MTGLDESVHESVVVCSVDCRARPREERGAVYAVWRLISCPQDRMPEHCGPSMAMPACWAPVGVLVRTYV